VTTVRFTGNVRMTGHGSGGDLRGLEVSLHLEDVRGEGNVANALTYLVDGAPRVTVTIEAPDMATGDDAAEIMAGLPAELQALVGG
jgi:hypothetical protein